jgi:hypothetical protein
MFTVRWLELLVALSWYGGRSMVTIRVTRGSRGQWRMFRAGYDYYAAAVPRMMVPIADTAGKGYYQNSKDYC